jgi:hypothetical protein
MTVFKSSTATVHHMYHTADQFPSATAPKAFFAFLTPGHSKGGNGNLERGKALGYAARGSGPPNRIARPEHGCRTSHCATYIAPLTGRLASCIVLYILCWNLSVCTLRLVGSQILPSRLHGASPYALSPIPNPSIDSLPFNRPSQHQILLLPRSLRRPASSS